MTKAVLPCIVICFVLTGVGIREQGGKGGRPELRPHPFRSSEFVVFL